MAVTRKDLGIATAYGYAKSKGYTGTEEEFALLMKSYADVAEEAREAADDAEDARDAITAMGVSCETLEPGSPATVQKIVDGLGTVTLEFGIPEGADGDITGDVIADEYSSSKTYAVGDHVMKSGHYYVCNTAITTAEAWTSAHWTEVAVGDEITDLKENINALFVTDTASGAIASFPDGADNIPVKDMTVQIEPVQDLHGQSSPYPAGGGKNKFNVDDIVPFNTSCTVTKNNGSFTVANSNPYVAEMFCDAGGGHTMTFSVTDGRYTISISEATTVVIGVYGSTDGTNFSWLANGILAGSTSATFTVSGQLYVQFRASAPANGSATIKNFQFESGETAHAWSPYSNICPISGWTGVDVVRCGKNLFDNEHATIYNRYIQYYDTTNANWVESDDSASYCIQVKPNTTYAIKPHGEVSVFRVCALSVDPSNIGHSTVVSTNAYSANASTYKYCTITTGANEKWLVIQLNKTVVEGRTGQVMVELGNTYSDFVPYSGTTYPISWTSQGTVYGGYEKPLTGKLKSSYVKQRLMPDWNWNLTINTNQRRFDIHQSVAQYVMPIKQNGTYISNALAPLDINQNGHAFGTFYIATFLVVHDKDSHFADVTAFKQWLTDNEVYTVYEVAEPTEYTLDTVTVTTLYGDNSVFADCGDVSVEYRSDTKLYIQKMLS